MRYLHINTGVILHCKDDEHAIEHEKKMNGILNCSYSVIVNLDTNKRIDVLSNEKLQWLADDRYEDYLNKYVVGNFNIMLVNNFKAEKDGKLFLLSFDYEGENYHCHTKNADAYFMVFGRYANERSEEYFKAKKDLLVEVARIRELI